MAKKRTPKQALVRPKKRAVSSAPPKRLVNDLRRLIDQAREQLARTVNSALVVLYWSIGRRIREDVLNKKRADYGNEIIATLSQQLTQEYGRGFGRRSLEQMVRFAAVFPDEQIAQTLSAQLSWSHFVELIPLGDPLKRDFYAEMCRIERWSVRTLRHKIGHLLYERTAVSKKPKELIEKDLATLREQDRMTPDLV
jgi:uncharacterized Zn finger protein